MWAIALQLLATYAGWQIIRALPLTWHRLEATAASIAVGYSLAGWVYFVVCARIGFPIGLPLATGLILTLVALSQVLLPTRATFTSRPYGHRWRFLARGVALGTAGIISYLVILSYQFPAPDGTWMSNGNVWGDAPLHVALINQFSHGQQLDLVSPVYKHVTLTYPLIADFWSGILMRTTTNWWLGLTLPSLIMMLGLLQLVFSFGYRLLGTARGAWLQFLMLVYSGSTHGAWVLSSVLFTRGLAAYHTAVGFSFAFATGDNYLNFIHSHPLPQRAYLFGMPLLIVVLIIGLSLYKQQQNVKNKQGALISGIVAGTLAGLLPLVHTHSFMVLAGLLTLATAGLLAWRKPIPAGWWPMLGMMALLAFPQIYWQFSHTFSSQFTHWIHGWMMQNFVPIETNWFGFWLRNVGALFIFILVGWLWLWRRHAKPELWLCYIAGTAIFLICNVYAFQPSLWDNMKFFEYGFWLIMLCIAAMLTDWMKTRRGFVVSCLIMLSLCLTGFYTLVLSGPKLNFELLSPADLKLGNELRTSLPKDAYVLVGDRHNHPVTMIAGAKVLMTFSGWYNLYGPDWPETLTYRDIMLHGQPGATELIQQYGLTHAVVRDTDANIAFFIEHYTLLTHQDEWWVFDLRR